MSWPCHVTSLSTKPRGSCARLHVPSCVLGSNPRVELGDRLVSVNGEEVEGLEWPLVSKMLELTEDDSVTNLGFFRDQVSHAACTPQHPPRAPSGATPEN